MAKSSKKSRKHSSVVHIFFYEWVLPIGLAFAVALFFRSTIASPRHVPTGSMIPTIKVGEFLFVNMMSYDWHYPYTRLSFQERGDPKHGEIIVFEYPLDPDKDYIKRVIGLPGDTVEVKDKKVILNGKPLVLEVVKDRSILDDLEPKYDPQQLSLFRETNGEHSYYVLHMNDREGLDLPPVTIPSDQIFVMGDNRDDSQDSRFWGFVPREKLLGKAGFTWFSFDKDHFPWVRVKRIFNNLHSTVPEGI